MKRLDPLTWRALTAEDAPALTRAYAAVEAVDHTDEHFSEQDIRDELRGRVDRPPPRHLRRAGPGR